MAAVDPEAGLARLDGAEDLDYDVGAVCLGAETAFYDIPGLREHATPLKRLEHARQIREQYQDVLEGDGRVVVGGAGRSGVQVAGELAAMSREHGHGANDDGERDGNAEDAPEVVLLEQLASVAPNFPENFQRAVADALGERGVEIRTNATVTSVDDESIAVADGDDLGYDQLVWTGGLQGPAALDDERPVVRSDLRLAGDTFAVGDAARVVDTDGEAVPASAQAAIREARVAAKNVTALVGHRLDGTGGFEPRLARYSFDSPGWLVSVGDGAVAQVGGSVLTGRAALALKTSVGAGYLGSVGAVENAVDLVQSELGLSVDEESDAEHGDEESDDDPGDDETLDPES